MSAQAKQQTSERVPRSQRYSTETRLAIVETRWEDVVPNLATKSDLREAETRLESSVALLRKDMEAMMTKVVIKLSLVIAGATSAAVALSALIQRFL